jgi:hypothetical protein
MLLFGASALTWWLAAKPATAHLPIWPAYVFGGVAVLGAYGMLAPLLGLPPWRARADMNRLLSHEWRALKRRRFWRRVPKRPPPEPVRIPVAAAPEPSNHSPSPLRDMA